MNVSVEELAKLRNGIKFAKFVGENGLKDVAVWNENKVVGLGETRSDGWLKVKIYF